MNKKVLVIAVALMVVAMLATPLVGTVMAEEGKGGNKDDFSFYYVGFPGPAEKQWDTPNSQHFRNYGFPIITDVSVTIGSNEPYNMLSTPVHVTYSCEIDSDFIQGYGSGCVRVRETITFYEGTVVLGTLEILAIGHYQNPLDSQPFVGHGTGLLEGVKVSGKVLEFSILPGGFKFNRIGSIMGWPSDFPTIPPP